MSSAAMTIVIRCLALASILLPIASFSPLLRYQGWKQQERWSTGVYSLHSSSLLDLDRDTVKVSTPSDDGTLVELVNPSTKRRVTIIGTAHLSEKSNELVEDIIASVKPDAVLIELDRTRLERIGLTESDLGSNFVTAEDIQPPLLDDDKKAMSKRPWWGPAMDIVMGAFSQVARKLLTGMYEDMGQNMGKKEVLGGGEFLAAVKAAKKNSSDTKIILGDRSSVVTIQRAAELAIRGGDVWGVFNRLNKGNKEEMEELEEKVRKSMKKDYDQAEFNVAMIETIKSDVDFRNRLFARLEKDVPEFTRAFLNERDYIMAEAIRRETDAKHIVAVVGLGHVPGMVNNLKQTEFQELP